MTGEVKPAAVQGGKRYTYLDLIRIVAAFLVVVNHTNSKVFKVATPAVWEWHASVIWYYVCKLAVPLYVMVSGACLLHKRDSYKRALWRVLRVAGALVVFSYGYYLYDAWVNYGLWPRAVQFDAFFAQIWSTEITNAFWYLYFFIGLMLALPLLQRLCAAMDERDMRYLTGLCFGVGAVWPLLVHYVPALTPDPYFRVPLASGYVGLFFAGHYVHHRLQTPKKPVWLWLCLVGCVLVSYALTWVEFANTGGQGKYWFMDDCMSPSIFIIAGSICVMALCKGADERLSAGRGARAIAELGACAFGVYLVQDWVIAQTRYRLFVPLSGAINPFFAGLLWSLLCFGVSLAAAWVLRRIPGLKRLL